MTGIGLFIAATILSCALTFLIWKVAESRRVHDVPNDRSMHTGRLAIGAGWAIVASLVVLWPLWSPAAFPSHGVVVLALVLVLAALSWIDDLRSLPPLWRLLVHVGAVSIYLSQLPADALVFGGALPGWVDRLVTGFCWVWFINLYNFMDGIDGITGTETIAISLGYIVLAGAVGFGLTGADAGSLTLLAIILAGAALGFLVWNWHPARIILGDVGSIPLGFLMGVLLLDLIRRGYLAAALILPMHHAADATYTFISRCLTVAEPWKPHRQHVYQRAVLGGLGVPQVVLRIAALDAVLIVLAVVSLWYPWPALLASAGVTIALLRNLGSRSAGEVRRAVPHA